MTKRGQQICRAIKDGRVSYRVVRLERGVGAAAAVASPSALVSMPTPAVKSLNVTVVDGAIVDAR